MIQRGGEVVLRMLSNVKQATIAPIIQDTIVPGTLIYTDEYRIYARLVACISDKLRLKVFCQEAFKKLLKKNWSDPR